MINWVKQLFSSPQKVAAETSTSSAMVEESGKKKLQGDTCLGNGDLVSAQEYYRQAIACDPNNSKAHSNLGFVLKELGNLAEAEPHLLRAIAIDPSIADAHYILGLVLQAQNKTDLALQHLHQAIELAPDLALAYRDLCFLLFQLGQFEDAKNVISKAIANHPQIAEFHLYQGNLLRHLGQAEEALQSYRNALTISPAIAEAHNNMGEIYQTQNQLQDAIDCFRMAVQVKADYIEAYSNLGIALQNQNTFEEALTCYEAINRINPNHAEVYCNMASAYIQLHQFDNARISCLRALELQPKFAEAYFTLGNALRGLEKLDEAIASFRQAIEIRPELAETHFGLGIALKDASNNDDAIVCLRTAIQLKPVFADAHYNLGIALQKKGLMEEAIASYRTALQYQPDNIFIHNDIGGALLNIDPEGAATHYRRTLEIDPDYANGNYNLGVVLQKFCHFEEALYYYRKAISLDPEYANAHNNAGTLLKDLARFDEAFFHYRKVLEIDPQFFEAHSNLLFASNYLPDQSARELLAEAQRFGDTVAQQAQPYTTWPNTPDSKRPLRVGLISGDLRQHPVGYFIEGILASLSSNPAYALELVAYSTAASNDALTTRIKAHCNEWHDAANLADQEFAQQIRQHRIDLLIDLSGHSAHNRLPVFAWKPAPVQISWLGYFATTGVTAIDYLIADPYTLPESEECHFTEKIWRLPESRLCFTAPDSDVAVSPLPARKNGLVTFGCFNNLSKMNDAVVALWARIMQAVPRSRLILKAQQLTQIDCHQPVLDRFAAHGIEADRLTLEGFSLRGDYLSSYHQVDLALDPFPYTGGTTTAESLWMGVPVLTRCGDSFLARQGVGLLMNAGLPEWVAKDSEEYFSLAVKHANHLDKLEKLRTGLRQQVLASPIFDATRFAEHFHTALRGMWEQWCEQHTPDGSPHQ